MWIRQWYLVYLAWSTTCQCLLGWNWSLFPMTPKFSRSFFVADEKLSFYLKNDKPILEREGTLYTGFLALSSIFCRAWICSITLISLEYHQALPLETRWFNASFILLTSTGVSWILRLRLCLPDILVQMRFIRSGWVYITNEGFSQSGKPFIWPIFRWPPDRKFHF